MVKEINVFYKEGALTNIGEKLGGIKISLFYTTEDNIQKTSGFKINRIKEWGKSCISIAHLNTDQEQKFIINKWNESAVDSVCVKVSENGRPGLESEFHRIIKNKYGKHLYILNVRNHYALEKSDEARAAVIMITPDIAEKICHERLDELPGSLQMVFKPFESFCLLHGLYVLCIGYLNKPDKISENPKYWEPFQVKEKVFFENVEEEWKHFSGYMMNDRDWDFIIDLLHKISEKTVDNDCVLAAYKKLKQIIG